MPAVETPASANEINAETTARLEKSYQGTLISKAQLEEEAPAFYSWLYEFGWFTATGKWRKYFLIFRKGNVPDEIRYIVHFFTSEHRYQISVHPSTSVEDPGHMSATVSARKHLTGEEHHRGNDLSDGDYSQDTWRHIQSDIMNYELVKLECWL